MDLLDFIKWLADWFNDGIYGWFEQAVAWAFTELFILWLQIKLWALKFAWGVANNLLTNLGVSATIASAWGALPSDLMQTALFFRVPDALNLLLAAGVTRFVLSFVPGW